MIGNKIADKTTNVSKKLAKELHNNDQTKEEDVENNYSSKKIHVSRRKTTNNWWIEVSTKKRCIFLDIIDELMLTLKNIHISRRRTTNF